MAYVNSELNRMLAELDIALQGADQRNQGSAKASAFRQGAQMEQAKDKMAAQAAGAEAYRSAATAGNTGSPVTPQGGPSAAPPPTAGTANFNAAFDQAMANPTPMDGTQNTQQIIQQELAARQALMNRNAVANAPMQAGGATPAPGAGGPYQSPAAVAPGTPPGVDPQLAAQLDALQRQQLGGMQGAPATQMAGAQVGQPVPQMPPDQAAYLRARGMM